MPAIVLGSHRQETVSRAAAHAHRIEGAAANMGCERFRRFASAVQRSPGPGGISPDLESGRRHLPAYIFSCSADRLPKSRKKGLDERMDCDLWLPRLVNALPGGIYVVDRTRTIILWNQVAEEITGYSARDMVGRSCSGDLLVHLSSKGEPLCAADLCPMAKSFRDGTPGYSVVYLRHKEGHRIRVLAQTVPVRDESGTVVVMGQVFQPDSSGFGLFWDREVVPRMDALDEALDSAAITEKQLQRHWERERAHLAAFLISIERLHEIEINRGPVAVQTVLHAVAKSIVRAFWSPHYLGLWTDRRFLLLVPHCDRGALQETEKELQMIVGSCSVKWWGDRIVPEVRIRSAFADEYESPEELLAKLDPTWAGSRLSR